MNSSTNQGMAPTFKAKGAMNYKKEAARASSEVARNTHAESVAIVDNAQIVDKEISQRNTS